MNLNLNNMKGLDKIFSKSELSTLQNFANKAVIEDRRIHGITESNKNTQAKPKTTQVNNNNNKSNQVFPKKEERKSVPIIQKKPEPVKPVVAKPPPKQEEKKPPPIKKEKDKI